MEDNDTYCELCGKKIAPEPLGQLRHWIHLGQKNQRLIQLDQDHRPQPEDLALAM